MYRYHTDIGPPFDHRPFNIVRCTNLQIDADTRFLLVKTAQYSTHRRIRVRHHIIGQAQHQFAHQTAVRGVDIGAKASLGTLDFSIIAINNVTPFSPTVGIFTLPYVIQRLEEAQLLTQGEVGKELVENTVRDAGVRIVGWAYTGFRVLTNSKKPVKTLDDLQA